MVNLITKHLDVWTAAQAQKSNGGRGRGNNYNGQSNHGIKKLRELILKLAVRGKLVPQDPKDEPASVLLEKISKEKERLLNEGKIKKPKSLLDIKPEEAPFEPPEGWEIVRLGSIGYWAVGSGFPKKEQGIEGEEILFSKVSDMNSPGNEHFIVSTANTVSQETANRLKLNVHMKGTVIFPKIGGAIATNKRRILVRPTAIDNNCLGLLPTCGISAEYLYLYLASVDLTKYQAGTSVPALSQGTLALITLGLPPLAEQRRIVAKVDELMALCDRLEQQQTDSNETHQTLVEILLGTLTSATDAKELAKTWQRIANHFDTLFTTEQSIDQLKQTILQLAVMGKLVPQDPNDEPASVLLGKIAKEKARLEKYGKIKINKPLPPIDGAATPFDLPQGWAWARFPEIGEFGRGKSKHRPRNDPSLYSDGIYPMVQTGDVARANGIISTFTALYNDEGLSQSRLWPAGTMCITIAANIADSGILGFDACFPDSVVGLIPSAEIGDSRYFEYFLRTAKEHLMNFAPSTAQKNINLGILKTVYIPLPPKEEIKRIVAKVDELMALCDELKIRLSDAQTTQVQLADAIVEGEVA